MKSSGQHCQFAKLIALLRNKKVPVMQVSVIERFKTIKADAGVDDMTAAILVLAESVDYAGTAFFDDTGNLNVRLTGDLETTTKE